MRFLGVVLLTTWIFSSDLRNLLNYFPERLYWFFLAPQALLTFVSLWTSVHLLFVHSCLYFYTVLQVQVLVSASKDSSYLPVKPFYILKILNPCQTYATNTFPGLPFPFLCDTIFLYGFLIFKFKRLSPRKIFLVVCFSPLYLYLFSSTVTSLVPGCDLSVLMEIKLVATIIFQSRKNNYYKPISTLHVVESNCWGAYVC